jgi:leucyl-tRNA synthetase
MEGAHRFLRRLWSLCYLQRHAVARGLANDCNWDKANEAVKHLRLEVYTLLKQADYDYQRIQYNTVVSAGMKMLNAIETTKIDASPSADAAHTESIGILLRVLYPIVPHITWQLWQDLGYVKKMGDLLDAPWPQLDASALATEHLELILQVNGKLRGTIRIAANASQEEIAQIARARQEVTRFLAGRAVKRVIVVPGKLVNIVG